MIFYIGVRFYKHCEILIKKDRSKVLIFQDIIYWHFILMRNQFVRNCYFKLTVFLCRRLNVKIQMSISKLNMDSTYQKIAKKLNIQNIKTVKWRIIQVTTFLWLDRFRHICYLTIKRMDSGRMDTPISLVFHNRQDSTWLVSTGWVVCLYASINFKYYEFLCTDVQERPWYIVQSGWTRRFMIIYCYTQYVIINFFSDFNVLLFLRNSTDSASCVRWHQIIIILILRGIHMQPVFQTISTTPVCCFYGMFNAYDIVMNATLMFEYYFSKYRLNFILSRKLSVVLTTKT